MRVQGAREHKKALPRLTGLRFLAALAVVLTHVGYHFTPIAALRTTETYGYEGVGLFFLLSGFVLTWSYNQQPAKRFWWQRFSKIWPTQLVVAVFAFWVLGDSERVPGPWGRVADLTLVQAWWPKKRVYYGGNGVSWSLSCEVFFYLLFPLLVVFVMRLQLKGIRRLIVATITVLVAAPVAAAYLGVAPHLSYWLFFVFPPYQLGAFLLGMAIARALILGVRFRAPRAATLLAVGWLILLAIVYTEYSLEAGTPIQRPVAVLLAMPAFAVLVYGLACSDLADRRSWLTSRGLVYLGVVSFEVYLIHKPVFLYASRWNIWYSTGVLGDTLHFVAYLATCILVASCLHYLVQRPVEVRLRSVLKQKKHRVEG